MMQILKMTLSHGKRPFGPRFVKSSILRLQVKNSIPDNTNTKLLKKETLSLRKFTLEKLLGSEVMSLKDLLLMLRILIWLLSRLTTIFTMRARVDIVCILRLILRAVESGTMLGIMWQCTQPTTWSWWTSLQAYWTSTWSKCLP